jgi:hypothetical protein
MAGGQHCTRFLMENSQVGYFVFQQDVKEGRGYIRYDDGRKPPGSPP